MPLYEYECSRCHHRFEKLQRFSDPPADKCPSCGGPVAQLLSAPAIQFKGSGWYVTDYARKNSSPAPSPGNGNNGASRPESKAETKGAETKSPAANK